MPVHPNQTPRLASHVGVRLREDTAYTDHQGLEVQNIRNHTEKTIDKLKEALNKVLETEEVILCIPAGEMRQAEEHIRFFPAKWVQASEFE